MRHLFPGPRKRRRWAVICEQRALEQATIANACSDPPTVEAMQARALAYAHRAAALRSGDRIAYLSTFPAEARP